MTDKNMIELLDVDFKKRLASLPFVMTNIPIAISVVKFEELDDLIKSANLSLKYASNDYDATINGVKSEKAANVNRFFHLKHAILDYNACYDYCCQIIFFAFEICGPINTNKDYKEALKQCRYNGQNANSDHASIFDALHAIAPNNECAKELLDRLKRFFDKRCIISNWANAIKHRGNLYLEGFEPQLPDIAFVKASWHFTKDRLLKFDDVKEVKIIKKIIVPCCITNEMGIKELTKHNKIICEFALWLYEFIGFSKIEHDRRVSTSFEEIRPFIFRKNIDYSDR